MAKLSVIITLPDISKANATPSLNKNNTFERKNKTRAKSRGLFVHPRLNPTLCNLLVPFPKKELSKKSNRT